MSSPESDTQTDLSDISSGIESPFAVYINSPAFEQDKDRFADLVLNDPQNVVDTLRTLHEKKDLSRIALGNSIVIFLAKTVHSNLNSPSRQIDMFFR